MSSSKANLIHEKFVVETQEEEKKFFVRQERHLTKNDNMSAHFDGKGHKVLDYSYFGLAFESESEYTTGQSLGELKLIKSDKTIGEYQEQLF